MKNFNHCINLLLKDEGGYTDDPSDSGGATNFGITITDYKKYINKNGTPADVRLMTADQAKTIYKTKYWDALSCDSLPAGVDYTCFDYGVHSGLGRPRKALDAFKDKSGADLVNAINNERMAFLKRLVAQRPKDQKFIKGWTNRVERVRAASLDLMKDKVSGPVAGTVVGGAAAATATQSHFDLILHHPYLTAAAVVLVAFAIGAAIHYVRNK